MDLLIKSFPGFAFACSLCFLFLSVVEYYIYSRTRYKRSLNIAIFCSLSSIYALEQFVGQSRVFTPMFTHYFGYFAQLVLMVSFCFYLKAMGFYIAYSERFFRVVVICVLMTFLAMAAFIPYYLFTGEDLFFDLGNFYDSGSYFFNSYTMRVGKPYTSIKVILNIFSLVSTIVTLNLLRMVWRGAKDLVLMCGLILSLVAAIYQYFLLPFTLSYFVPVVFIANMFEALRMSFLSVKEYILEEKDRGGYTLSSNQTVEGHLTNKYQNLGLNQERMDELVCKLRDKLDSKQTYLNPNLRLEDLAREIRVPSYQLTQVIRIGFKTNFSDLINGCRINLVKKKLANPELKHKNIVDIAYDSGFNSKSTFNTTFKKITKMTPSEYRKSAL